MSQALRKAEPVAPVTDAQALDALCATLAASAAQLDRDAEFPHANLALLRDAGLLGLATARRFGGNEAERSRLREVIGAVARGEPSTALLLAMQYINLRRLQRNATSPRPLVERVLRESVSDGALINAFRVEPELGSPARGGLPQTIARRHPDGWRLSGHKLYTTGIPGLTWLLVWARSDDPQPLVGGWLVHRDTPGIRVIESWDHLGMRATGSHEVIFEDVQLPPESAVDVHPLDRQPGLDAAAVAAFQGDNAILLAALYDGVARAARDDLLGWLARRVPGSLGAPLSSLPRVQEAVGRIDALLLSSRLQLRGSDDPALSVGELGQIKVNVIDNAIDAVRRGLELAGNHALEHANPLQRHYRNLLCGRVHTPQPDSVWLAAGKAAFATF
ncbi:acyl-CoA dehydrogenase family protein [Pseudomonas kuykendallii]|uniref:Acyl-CoA dehydrogenase n=1 Tax=Pseudomonas kuykendallii TaxID=1007099 RepID=A0A2W5CTA4_9PSED|nr:MAG: acyl-CoA dehydrogenase [Pseudomonas kuykendallii]